MKKASIKVTGLGRGQLCVVESDSSATNSDAESAMQKSKTVLSETETGRGEPSGREKGANAVADAQLTDSCSVTSGLEGLDMSDEVPHTGATTVCPKQPGGEMGRVVQLRANMRPLHLTTGVMMNRYEVHVVASNPLNAKYKEVSKGAFDDYERMTKREICWSVYKTAVPKHRHVFTKPYGQVYDRNRLLYSLQKLDVPITIPNIGTEHGEYDLQITLPTEGPNQIDVGALESLLGPDLAKRDRVLQQLLELVTSQQLYKDDEYLPYGGNFYHKSNTVDLREGRYLAQGLSKRVKVVEGRDTQPQAVVQVDLKKTAIFKEQGALETVIELLGLKRDRLKSLNLKQRQALNKLFRELRVITSHREKNTDFLVHEVSKESASQITLTIQDEVSKSPRTLSVADFFAERYKKLEFPQLPCLVQLRDKRDSAGHRIKVHYPMEVCNILPYQRVPIYKQTDAQQKEMIARTAVPPVKRLEEIKSEEKRAGLESSNKFLLALQVTVDRELMAMEGRVLASVRVQYNKQTSAVQVSSKGKWEMKRGQQWFRPATCNTHAVVALGEKTDLGLQMMSAFMDVIYRRAEETGLQLGSQLFADMVPTLDHLHQFFQKAMEKCVQFVLIVLNGRDDELKNLVKYYEQQSSVITQCVLYSTVENVLARKRSADTTLLNILAKTNMKLGGLNYVISRHEPIVQKWLCDDVMFVGIDVNHPPPLRRDAVRKGIESSEPSVVGMVATTKVEKLQMTMDYHYQSPRMEEVVSIRPLTAEMLTRYKMEHDGNLPKRIVVYRDGVADGQFKMVLESEVVGLEDAFAAVGGADYKPKLTVVTCQKRHNTRLFLEGATAGAKPQEQNVAPGTVVDRVIVHPTDWEFYLCSHAAQQGTAKSVRYTVLRDDNGFTSDELQSLTFVLSHGHQIITKTVSLPAPVMAAHDAAMRGKKVWKAHSGSDDLSSTSSGGSEVPNWTEVSALLRASDKINDKAYWA